MVFGEVKTKKLTVRVSEQFLEDLKLEAIRKGYRSLSEYVVKVLGLALYAIE